MRQIQFRDLNQNLDILQDIQLSDGDKISYECHFDEISSMWLKSQLLEEEMEPFRTYREMGCTVRGPKDVIDDFIFSTQHRFVDSIENGTYQLVIGNDDALEIELVDAPFIDLKSKLICRINFYLKSIPKFK